ncbi:hypothetical protein NUH88_05985 [Nisaea acidiphila]|uniref:Uncharacterized protein n=1 Tax=Nisaea acidiphila TaxID=1862145 RepID=A0A9J7AV79_9PROT|nr:hypothetical protein [Nisaea acidiphila]UUX51239.1 hypothetical protein NUH88_05985 [Nisaea acidiphila]
MTTGGGHERASLEEQLFLASSLAQDLRAAVFEAVPRIGLSELAHSLLVPDTPEAQVVLDRAVQDPIAARMLEQVARRVAVATFAEVAAASSGDLAHRTADGFNLRLLASLAEDGPLYLLVDRTEAGAGAPRLLVCIPVRGEPVLTPLPEDGDYPLQLLLAPDAPLVEAFRDPDTRFFLT